MSDNDDVFLDLTQDDSSIDVVSSNVKPKASAITVRKAASLPLNDSSDDDSDSSLLLAGGPVFARATAATVSKPSSSAVSSSTSGSSRPCKEKSAAAAKISKEERQRLREEQKLEREANKLLEKEIKKRRIQQAQQSMGKFASSEIAILIEPLLTRINEEWSGVVESLKETYITQEYDGGLGGRAVQWIRKDFLAGGAEDAMEGLKQRNQAGYQHLDRLVVVFDEPKRFLTLLERKSTENDDGDDDYPALETWLVTLQSAWQAAWKTSTKKKPRLVLLLHQVTDEVNRQWNAHRRSARSPPPPSDAELHDAIIWLLVQYQVECILCASVSEASDTLKKMTRALSEEPYMQQVTELECIKKIKSGDHITDKAKDCWVRQLQQVPRLSESMALCLVQHYPTARSLWEAYHSEELTETEKRLLVSNLFHEDRRFPKLSDSLYRLMTSTDPQQLL